LGLANSSVLLRAHNQAEQREPLPTVSRTAQFFIWTLTHSAKAFSEIKPIFRTRQELEQHFQENVKRGKIDEQRIFDLALLKINCEWRAWTNIHSEIAIDEKRLDDILIRAIYRLIINRDSGTCVSCNSPFDLTIHHIIPKKRNHFRRDPPFGRSVPTNLITLCKTCHSICDPFFLS
jgi:hypothetical protein